MKKVVSKLLSLVLVCSLAGCNASSKGVSGTFEGVSDPDIGMHGEVKVQLTLDNNKITAVDITEQNETPDIAAPALKKIPEEIVAQNSVAVDTVSGATRTSNAILDAATNALKKAGVKLEDYQTKTEKEAKDKDTVEKEADVVVIGGGGAGLAAAVSAKQAGASVIVLEKMPALGGSTIIAGGQYNAYDPDRQKNMEMRQENLASLSKVLDVEPANDLHKQLIDKVKAQLEDYKKANGTYTFDSAELHALQTFEGGDRVGDLNMIYQLTKGAQESVGWLESLGAKVEDKVGMVTGALWPRTHQFVKPLFTGPIDAYKEYLNGQDGVEIMMNTKANELEEKDHRITGVVAEDDDHIYHINAKNGVVIATGGFARNPELIKKYDTHWGNLDGLGSTNAMGATGDGIIMAEKVGADLVGMEWIQLLPVGNPETGGMSGNISINAANQLFINLNGDRFVAEDARRDTLTEALLKQPEKKMFILHDAHEYTSGDVKNDFNESIDELVKKGLVVKGDTIEELAKNMGVDADHLKKAIDTYNEAVEGKIEDPQGKKVMDQKFDKAPFYAGIRVPTIHHTMGGIKISPKAEVLDKDGKVIEGLFAAGEVTGGIHGSNRLGGNALPDTVVFGRIAGQSAANHK